MSPVKHPVSGAALSFNLDREIETVRGELASAPARVARTLVKEGALRVTLVGITPGGMLRPHSAAGPITIQVLEGEIEVETGGHTHALTPGMLLALNAGVSHGVGTPRGGVFLLTVAGAPDEHRAPR